MATNVFQFIENLNEGRYTQTPNFKGKEAEYFVVIDLLPYSPIKVMAESLLYIYGIYVDKDDDKAIEILKKGYQDFPDSYFIECLIIEINGEFSMVPCKPFMSKSEFKKLKDHHYDDRKFDYSRVDLNKDFKLEIPENYGHGDLAKHVLGEFLNIKIHIDATFDALITLKDLSKLEEKYDAFYLALKLNYGYKNILFDPAIYYQKLINFVSEHPEYYLDAIFDDADHLCGLRYMNIVTRSENKFDLYPIFNLVKNDKFGPALSIFVTRFIDFNEYESTSTLALLLYVLLSTYIPVPYAKRKYEDIKKRKDIGEYEEIVKLIDERLPNVDPDWYW